MVIPGRNFAFNLVQRRTLLFQLVRRDFEQRFVGSAAGWLWALRSYRWQRSHPQPELQSD